MAEMLNQSCQRRAEACIPGGVNSPVRSFGHVGVGPIFARRAKGAHLWDVEENRYIDLLMSWGALPLGHAHPAVLEAAGQAIQEGSSFGMSSPREAPLAEIICDAVESIERVRFVNSGTEAVMTALRLARGITGRQKVLIFEGGYHGHSDGLLVQAGSGLGTLNLPASAGVPKAYAEQTLLATYNDLSSANDQVDRWGEDIAAILVEPVAGNMGVVPPQPDFLQGLRDIATQCGALLIFDEVITGFRVAWGGMQPCSGVRSDLTTLGKIIGGGFPVGAVGGRAEIMERLAPQGDVYQAGTLSGNPVVMAAGRAALEELRHIQPYDAWDQACSILRDAVLAEARQASVPIQFQSVGSMFTIYFSETPVTNYSQARTIDTAAHGRFYRAAMDRGLLLPPSPYEACFLCTSHLAEKTMAELTDALRHAIQQGGRT